MKIARACRDRAVKPLYSLLTIQLSLDQHTTVFTAVASLRLTTNWRNTEDQRNRGYVPMDYT
jgi:hypothetical protein